MQDEEAGGCHWIMLKQTGLDLSHTINHPSRGGFFFLSLFFLSPTPPTQEKDSGGLELRIKKPVKRKTSPNRRRNGLISLICTDSGVVSASL